MGESETTQDNITYIRTHVDGLERMVRFQMRSDPNVREEAKRLLEARTGAPELYLALGSGPMTQAELVALKFGTQPTVSKVLSHLEDAGFVTRGRRGKDTVFLQSDFEQVVKLSKIARGLVRAKAPTPTRSPRKNPKSPRSDGPAGTESDLG